MAATASAAVQIPDSVIVDRSEPAYTVFTRVPENAPRADIDKLGAWLAKHPQAEVVGWKAFQNGASDIIAKGVRKNDYTDCDVGGGIPKLLAKYPGGPFGVTFNGGIAFTYNDYQHTKRLFAGWRADPTRETRPKDVRVDPIYPNEHLVPLLGR